MEIAAGSRSASRSASRSGSRSGSGWGRPSGRRLRGLAGDPSGERAVGAAGRLGLLARGATYLIVGCLAVRIAFGHPSRQADRAGALHTVAGTPFGAVLLWLLAAGFAGMALWRLYVAAFGDPTARHPGRTRLAALARGVFYAGVAASTVAFVARHHSPRSSDEQSRDLTARAMQHGGGRVLVGAVGAGLAVAGVVLVVRAVRRRFERHLRTYEMGPRARRVVRVLGTAGHAARGLVFGLVGVFLARAAITVEPDQAKGLDNTLRSIRDTTAGPWLLLAVAVGLVAFGLYSCCEARWRRTT